MRRSAWGALGLACGVLLLWTLLGDREPAPRPIEEPSPEETVSVPVDPPPPPEAPARRVAGTRPPASEPERPAPASISVAPEPPKAAVGTLSVLVFDSQGRPVAGALVEAWPFDGGTVGLPSTPPLDSRLTDASGRCSVPMESRSAKLVASKEGVGSSGILLASGHPEEVKVELQPLAAIRGNVLRADGTPAEGARVLARSAGIMVAAGLPRSLREPPVAVADLRGEFEIEADAGGPLRVHAQIGGERTRDAEVWTKPGSVHEVTLRFPGAFSVSGVLLAPDGNPVSGGTVCGFQKWANPPMSASISLEQPEATSKEDGSFLLRITQPGEYTVIGSEKGFANSLASTVVLDEANPLASLSLSLHPPAAVAGRVRWADRRAVAGRPIWATPDGAPGFTPTHGRPGPGEIFGTASGLTGKDGSFRLAPLHPLASYTLSVSPDRERRDSLAVRSGVRPGGVEVEIVVTEEEVRGVVLSGIVESGATGEPLRRYRLRLSTEMGEQAWKSDGWDRPIEDAEGRFRIEGLRAGGRYSLEVMADEHASVLVDPWEMGPEGREVRLRLPRPGSLEVRVVDGAGRAVPFASVSAELLTTGGRMGRTIHMAQRTDESGLARIDGLTPGRTKVHAWLGERRAETEAKVPVGATAVVEVRLQP